MTVGLDTNNAEALAAGVRRLARGLPAEDELSVILSWLGHCRLIHKLDQLQIGCLKRDVPGPSTSWPSLSMTITRFLC